MILHRAKSIEKNIEKRQSKVEKSFLIDPLNTNNNKNIIKIM